MKFFLTLTFSLFSSLLLFSQERRQRGFVITNEGDTLKGWINYGNWKINPSRIVYRSDSGSTAATQYAVSEIRYFEITGADAYRSALVTRDMRSVNPLEITAQAKDTTLTAAVFLRVLVSGKKLTLYEFTDFKNHYFIQRGTDSVEELLYKLYANADESIISEWNNYRDQLREYAGEGHSSSLDKEIEYAKYDETKLVKIVSELNGRNNLAVYGGSGAKSWKKPQFFVSAGAALSTISFTGDNGVSEVGMNYKQFISPLLSIGVDLLTSRNFNDFTFRLEIGLSQKNYEGDRQTKDFYGNPTSQKYSLKQSSISPSLSGMYNFRRTKKTRYFAGAGMSFNFSSYSTNRFVQTIHTTPEQISIADGQIGFEKFWPSVFLRAGARLNQKFEIDAAGDILGSITSYVYFKATPRNYSLKLTYFFL
ncbi:MAG: outer membrane beta-barrel protein [Puia sp.]|nr:outer membrane beta-barrel protein [Puia sp.]